jgi:hypothetical protein
MSPDPVFVERLNQHGQSHLLQWWGELNDDAKGRLAAELGAIDFGQLDGLIAELVRNDAVNRSRSFGCRRPTVSASSGAGPVTQARTLWPRARWG